MTDQQIKVMFSKEVLRQLGYHDNSAEMCLRRILFGERNKIDWQDAYRMALHDMPELKNYKAE